MKQKLSFEDFAKSVRPKSSGIQLPEELKGKATATLYWHLYYIYEGRQVLQNELPWQTGGFVYQIAFHPKVGLRGTFLDINRERFLLESAGNPVPKLIVLPEPMVVLPTPPWSILPFEGDNLTPKWCIFKSEANTLLAEHSQNIFKLLI